MGLFDIYNKEDWRTIMAKEKEDRLKKVLEDMSYSLNHIEDIMADDRELLVKLVKQNNTIVEYLKQLDVEIVDQYGEPLTKEEEEKVKKFENFRKALNEFKDKRKDLVEFEKELKKNKDMLTPGQVGEA